MRKKALNAGGWGASTALMSEDSLLLAEMTHRVGNEVLAAIAAMRLSLASPRPDGRLNMVHAAIERLEGFAEVLNVLNTLPQASTDIAPHLERMCRALCAARTVGAGTLVSLDLGRAVVDGATARRVMMICSELIHNSLRHALDGRHGTLSVILRRYDAGLRLVVMDDGPGVRPEARSVGTGMGGPIVAQLVARGGGTMKRETDPFGTKVKISLPLSECVGDGAGSRA